jgi:hypothetical protein
MHGLGMSDGCRFEEACAAYSAGGRPELGLALLQQLADTAVLQCRFADAAHGYYKLAMVSLEVGGTLMLLQLPPQVAVSLAASEHSSAAYG